jgi:hypothetical protein
MNTELASSETREIVSAAYYGKVETLFVAVGIQQWGIFDPKKGNVQLHQKKEQGDTDLLDFAAVQTIMNSGTVYAEKQDMIPERTHIAAIYRY